MKYKEGAESEARTFRKDVGHMTLNAIQDELLNMEFEFKDMHSPFQFGDYGDNESHEYLINMKKKIILFELEKRRVLSSMLLFFGTDNLTDIRQEYSILIDQYLRTIKGGLLRGEKSSTLKL